ncbi:MAG TPA: hypothetical protein DCY07_07670 [Rhodospirillaceae bacterium]|nr:hypothetical protein [Rhodospirillaceae bacterium]
MPNNIETFRTSNWAKNPLIAGALAAAARSQTPRLMRVSTQVARCVHLPAHLVSLDGQKFFPTSSYDKADRIYRRTSLFLETLLKEEPFLS